MDILDSKKNTAKKSIPAGTVFALQGSLDKAFVILHTGMAEVLSFDGEASECSADLMIQQSVRIGFVKGESLLGIMGIMQADVPNEVTLRTMTDCTISIKPMDFFDLTTKLYKDTALNLRIHRSLITHSESTFYIFRNLKYLWHKFASIADSLALGADLGDSGEESGMVSRLESNLEEYSVCLKNRAKEKKDTSPKNWDYNIFLGRIQDKLCLYEDQDKNTIERHIDMSQYAFIKRLLQKHDDVVIPLLEKDEPFNRYVLDFLSKTVTSMLRANKDIVEEIYALTENLYKHDGWAARIKGLHTGKGNKIENFLHFLAKFSYRTRKDTINLLGVDLLEKYPVFSELRHFNTLKGPEKPTPASSTDSGNKLAKYTGLLDKLLDFGDMPEDMRNEFRTLMDMLADGSGLRSYERLNELFWNLYERCFLKIVGTDLKSFVPGVMLHMGVVDERLLSKEELAEIDACYSNALFADLSVPVMTLPYYLEKIYKGDVTPSVTEMGDSFAAVLKAQDKLTPKEKKNSYLFKDVHDDRVRFELRNVAKELQGMLFGNRKKALPFLTSEQIHNNAARMFVEPEKLVGIINEYRSRDFSLFYREYLLKHDLGSDFIQGEIVPDFVLYPGYGTRAVMWQEMGKNKRTPGRIFFPSFFQDKLDDAVLTQLAYYRWELQKTVAGHNWTDPVEGGLAGAYYDYISFYKKNPAISSEARARLAEFIKRTKSDKDRFAQEYKTWLAFEYSGMMKLNPAAREIFYRHCPFPELVRKTMAKKPAFSTMATRFDNNRKKEIMKIQTRVMKYEKAKKPLPEELAEYMQFLET